MRARLILILLLATALLAAGCHNGPRPSTSTESFSLYLLPEKAGDNCNQVVAVRRDPQDEGGVHEALRDLLAGPSEDEVSQGYGSWFSSQTAGMLRDVTVEDGVARVDFEDFRSLLTNATSSCGSTALLAQLDHTVLQFPEIDHVVYAFEGDRAAFYEWLQRDPPEL